MLNLITKKKLIKNNNYKKHDNVVRVKSCKHFPSSTREWKDSVFYFNKTNINLIPSADKSSIKIIKDYFSLFNNEIEKKIRIRKFPIRRRKKSKNKIFVSDGEFKHTNNNLTISLYLFNRQKNSYKWAINKIKSKFLYSLGYYNKILIRRLNFLKRASLYRMTHKKLYLIKKLRKNSKNKTINNYVNLYLENYFKNILNIERKKRLLYFYYKKISYINKSKYTYRYLQYLKKYLSKLYNKKIEFNLINLKGFSLNIDIVSETLIKKISKVRRKTRRYIKGLKDKLLVVDKRPLLGKIQKNLFLKQRTNLSKSNKLLMRTITKNLKYRHLTGFRIQAKGRLTRRYTAERSISNIIYKGNLVNIDSSWRKLSSVLLKGNLKSNVQYTKLSSKSSIGSFGIKGWISGN
jgi:hypothetical protein